MMLIQVVDQLFIADHFAPPAVFQTPPQLQFVNHFIKNKIASQKLKDANQSVYQKEDYKETGGE